MNELNNFFLGVQQVAQDAVDKAPYDRTFRGVIEEINGDGTCNVRINGRTYENIPLPTNLTDLIYPVGSIYMSVNDINPSVLFGGSWQQIKDTFLLSAGDSYNAGDVGGSADAVVVEHSHSVYVRSLYTLGGTADGNISWNGGTISSNGVVSAGESGVGKNMPPYLVVYMWQRIG